MDPLALTFASICATSVMLAIGLTVAWRRFEREPHVLFWALGFVCATTAYGAQLLKQLLDTVPSWSTFSIAGLIVSFTLMSIGFRSRAGLAGWRWLAIGAIAVIAGLTAGWLVAIEPAKLDRAILSGLIALNLLVSAIAVHRAPAVRRAPGKEGFWFLALAAGYAALLTGSSLVAGHTGETLTGTHRLMFLLGVPTALMGTGLIALILVGADMAERLRRLAEVDPLTGALNRRGLEHAAARLIALARRSGWPVAVVVADLDRFKAVNDRFGHALGDRALQRFAGHAAASLRGGDVVGRLGGEEFVFVLAEADAVRAVDATERLRAGLAEALADLELPFPLTASFGIAVLGDRNDGLVELLARADAALYESKEGGRDRITVAPPVPRNIGDPRVRVAWPRPAEPEDRRDAANG